MDVCEHAACAAHAPRSREPQRLARSPPCPRSERGPRWTQCLRIQTRPWPIPRRCRAFSEQHRTVPLSRPESPAWMPPCGARVLATGEDVERRMFHVKHRAQRTARPSSHVAYHRSSDRTVDARLHPTLAREKLLLRTRLTRRSRFSSSRLRLAATAPRRGSVPPTRRPSECAISRARDGVSHPPHRRAVPSTQASAQLSPRLRPARIASEEETRLRQ